MPHRYDGICAPKISDSDVLELLTTDFTNMFQDFKQRSKFYQMDLQFMVKMQRGSFLIIYRNNENKLNIIGCPYTVYVPKKLNSQNLDFIDACKEYWKQSEKNSNN